MTPASSRVTAIITVLAWATPSASPGSLDFATDVTMDTPVLRLASPAGVAEGSLVSFVPQPAITVTSIAKIKPITNTFFMFSSTFSCFYLTSLFTAGKITFNMPAVSRPVITPAITRSGR